VNAVTDMFTRNEPVKWLFAGDSITHGALHTLGWRDFTEHFSERVRWELRRTHDIVIKTGISGWKITDLVANLQWNVLQFNADVVLMKFGMNDCTLGAAGRETFVSTYCDVIETIRERGSLVVLQTPNPVLEYGGAPRVDEIADYRAAVLHVAAKMQTPVVDHYARWIGRETIGTLQHLLVDGFHPNEYGHRLLAHGLFEELGIWDPAGSLTCQLMVPRLPG